MAFKMKGPTFYGKSPLKQATDPKKKKKEKTYPPEYTKKDIEFL